MLKILANQYYGYLRNDIQNTEIILTQELMDLHDNLCKLHALLLSCQLVEPNQLVSLKDVFSRNVFEYIGMAKYKLHEIIPLFVNRDLFQPMGMDCFYSHSLRDLFASIGRYSNYIFHLKN